MSTQLVTNLNTPLCRHGMRDDCPIEHCNFYRKRSSLLYSAVLKERATTPALAAAYSTAAAPKGSSAHTHQVGMHDKYPREMGHFNRRARPPPLRLVDDSSAAPVFTRVSSSGSSVGVGSSDSVDGSRLAQAADGLTVYREWLEHELVAQKAKIMAMSSRFSIPVHDLDSNAFELGSLPGMPTPVGNAIPTPATTEITMPMRTSVKRSTVPNVSPGPIPPWVPGLQPPVRNAVVPTSATIAITTPVPTAKRNSVSNLNVPVVPISAPGPRIQPAQAVSAPPTQQLMPVHARVPVPQRQLLFDQQPAIPMAQREVVSKRPVAPKKGDMAYKTTPCKHYTMNQGWCPWGDQCGFIHDPQLEWAPPSERTSGRSTPSSTTLVGSRSALLDQTTAPDPPRSVSSRSAHCWGFIQGTCARGENCEYFHPPDIGPYIPYTPCLTWPLCGYPNDHCAFKHKPSLQPNSLGGPPSAPAVSTIVPPSHNGANILVRQTQSQRRADVLLSPLRPSRAQLPPVMLAPVPLPAVEAERRERERAPPLVTVIPQDEAYASAKWHHMPTTPSAEMFSLAPVRPAVRLSRPSEDASGTWGQSQPATPGAGRGGGGGGGGYLRHARRVSIAVQKFDAERAARQTQGREGVKGHARGKSFHL
ncbi:hypothetical protein BC827DRAFT_1272706 [Russula dissimulans]|nr:hypothetical protein BC827DRAFT_1272706 [Russula dissimulans]